MTGLYWWSFWYGSTGDMFSQLLAYDWIIPMTLILVAYVLLPMRGRLLFWFAASLAVMSYAAWLALYLPPAPV